jgi:hypothetical protein
MTYLVLDGCVEAAFLLQVNPPLLQLLLPPLHFLDNSIYVTFPSYTDSIAMKGAE